MVRATSRILPTLGIVVLFALAGCGGTSGATGAGQRSSSAATATASPVVVVKTKTVTVDGKSQTVLADTNGKTLYYFVPDSSSKIACTGGCASNWPPLLLPSGAPASATALSGKLTVLDGPNGRQVLYNGHPLYGYSKDEDAGDAYGQGVGGKWYVATPDLS